MASIERITVGAGWHYHPLEVVVRANGQESTLALGLARRLAATHKTGFVRHGRHISATPSDASGLDAALSEQIWAVVAANGQDSLFTQSGHFDLPTQRTLLSDADMVVVEGRLESDSPIVVELDSSGQGLEDLSPALLAAAVAVVGDCRPAGKLPAGGIPWFASSQLDALTEHLLEVQDSRLRQRPFWGLLLASQIPTWPDSVQLQRFLSDTCDRVFVAASDPAAWSKSVFESAPDLHSGLSELGRILSCLETFPRAAFLVASDRSPRIPDALVHGRDPYRAATTFREPDTHLPQRFPSIWEPKSRMRIHQALAADIRCPQRILTHSRIQLLDVSGAPIDH